MRCLYKEGDKIVAITDSVFYKRYSIYGPSGLYDQVNKELAKTFALVKANEAKYKATCDKYNV